MASEALSAYRVLDLAGEPGAYGTKLLADLGANVLKVEPPGGDATRNMPPFYKDQAGAERSLNFAYMNTNKRGITLNLDSPEGQILFRQLGKRADVVVEAFPAGHLAERGIGYQELSQANPGLVWVALTPFGQTGPRRDWKGSNLIAWAASGLLFSTGERDRPPVSPGGPLPLAYFFASLNAAAGALLALQARRRQGKGQFVDISLQEAAIAPELSVAAFLEDLIPRVRTGSNRPASSPNGLYPCKDGHVALVVTQPHHWDAFAAWMKEVIGNEAVMDPAFRERRYRIQVREALDEWAADLTRRYTKQALFEEGQRRGIPVTPVETVADISHDPHLEAVDYWAEMPHPALGPLRMPGAPYRFSKTPWQAGRPPLLGEHNEDIYCGELGISTDDLTALRSRGVI